MLNHENKKLKKHEIVYVIFVFLLFRAFVLDLFFWLLSRLCQTYRLFGFSHFFGCFQNFLDTAAHVKSLFGDFIVFALTDLFEGSDGIFNLDVNPGFIGKCFGHVEGL